MGEKVVGAIGIVRHEPVGFADKQIALVELSPIRP